MKKRLEIKLLRLLFVFGVGAFFNLIRKPPMKDWLLIFLMKSYIATILDNLLVKKGYLKYPVKLSKLFDVSVLFSYLLFPISCACVYFNQVTKKSGLLAILVKSLFFSVPSAIAEHYIEKYTKLIEYKRSWTSIHSFGSIALTFLAVRFLIGIIRKSAEKQTAPFPPNPPPTSGCGK